MNKRLLKSVISLAGIMVLGATSTFAAFSSNAVTLAGNTMSAGDSRLRICDEASTNNWLTSVPTNFVVTELIPESSTSAGVELTDTGVILVGNDDGSLTQNDFQNCFSYGQPPGHSNIALKMDPTVSAVQCSAPDIDTSMELKFEFFNSAEVSQGASTWKSLRTWTTNTLEYGPVFNPNDVYQMRVYARLRSGDHDDTLKNATCTFDINLIGSQATATTSTS